MRSRQLEQALADHVDAAAAHLRAELAGGAEVPFEVGTTRAAGQRPALYCYRALTAPFIGERDAALKRLPGHAECVDLLEHFDGLERYLAGAGTALPNASRRGRASAAIRLLLEDVFEDQTDFEPRPERVRAALDRLQRSASADEGQVSLLAALHGLAIESPRLALRTGLAIAQPEALSGLPTDALRDGTMEGACLLVLHTAETEDVQQGLSRGREALGELVRALRLFGDCQVRLGGLAWSRVNGDPWQPLALDGGDGPAKALVLPAEQEDELRAFCNLIARRSPREGELAWALRRFELGCDRASPLEGLTDHLLALRALLEPEGSHSGLLAGRLAALCAEPGQGLELTRRVVAAIELERAAVAGAASKPRRVRSLAGELATHLRALLSDVIGGHLDHDLAGLADRLLQARDEDPDVAGGAAEDPDVAAAQASAQPEAAAEEPVGV